MLRASKSCFLAVNEKSGVSKNACLNRLWLVLRAIFWYDGHAARHKTIDMKHARRAALLAAMFPPLLIYPPGVFKCIFTRKTCFFCCFFVHLYIFEPEATSHHPKLPCTTDIFRQNSLKFATKELPKSRICYKLIA